MRIMARFIPYPPILVMIPTPMFPSGHQVTGSKLCLLLTKKVRVNLTMLFSKACWRSSIDHLILCWRMTGTHNTGETSITFSLAHNGSARQQILADRHDSGSETMSKASCEPKRDGQQASHSSDQEGESQLPTFLNSLERSSRDHLISC
jgi:hypothetical protein